MRIAYDSKQEKHHLHNVDRDVFLPDPEDFKVGGTWPTAEKILHTLRTHKAEHAALFSLRSALCLLLCITSSNKCLTSSNKKLLGTSASLLVPLRPFVPTWRAFLLRLAELRVNQAQVVPFGLPMH